MTPILRLFVIVRVEINVMQYDDVGSGQVDAHAASFRRQQKYKNVAVCVECVDKLLPVKNKALTEHYNTSLGGG